MTSHSKEWEERDEENSTQLSPSVCIDWGKRVWSPPTGAQADYVLINAQTTHENKDLIGCRLFTVTSTTAAELLQLITWLWQQQMISSKISSFHLWYNYSYLSHFLRPMLKNGTMLKQTSSYWSILSVFQQYVKTKNKMKIMFIAAPFNPLEGWARAC